MSTVNLTSEMETFGRNLRFDQATYLHDMIGESLAAMIARREIGAARGLIEGDFWQPDPAGPTLVVLAVKDEGALIDIVAFDVRNPDVWALRTGNGMMLGADLLGDRSGAWEGQEGSLPMVATPLEWAGNAGQAVCVIDGFAPATVIALRQIRQITVIDRKFAAALRLQLSRPERIPEISVIGGHRRAA